MRARKNRLLAILLILMTAFVLRELAATRLPGDYDEPIYFRAGQLYAGAIRAGDLQRFTNIDYAGEHPALVNVVYGLIFSRFPPIITIPPPEEWGGFEGIMNAVLGRQYMAMFAAARHASLVFGLLNVLLVAAVSPAAGALLAVHTYTVKYTSQVYLEALPMLTATLAVFAYMRARSEATRRPVLWWALSAVALGLTAAAKYVYCVAGVAILADYLWHLIGQRRAGEKSTGRGLLVLTAWGGLALLVFYAANPYLWPDPLGRLTASLAFHAAYSQGAHVQEMALPWYQPFIWLFTAQPFLWHPGIIISPFDVVTAVLAVVGLRFLWPAYGGRGRVLVLWWAIGLAFLLLWNTKWPQYSLILTVPMSLSAAAGLRWLWGFVPAEVKASVSERYGW
jgi:hypothetical protein